MAIPSFGLTGATPKQPSLLNTSVGGSTTPAAKALTTAQSGLPANLGANFNVATKQNNPEPSTAVKKTTSVDGSTVEYHKPEATPGLIADPTKGGNTTALPQGTAPTQPTTPTYPGLVGTVAKQGEQPSSIQQQATDQSKQAFDTYQGYNKDIQNARVSQAKEDARIHSIPIGVGDQTGRSQVANQYYADIIQGLGGAAQGASALYSPALSGATTAQGQQFGAAQNAANLAKPELGAFGQGYYNPLDTKGGAASSQYGTGPAAAANVKSIQDLTGQASAIQAQANGAEQNFNLMLDIAKQGGVNDANVPILNTLQQNVGRGLTSSAAIANFQSLIQSVRSQYASILGGGTVTVEALQEAQSLIPNDISLSALESLGQNLQKDAGNRVAGFNQQIQQLSGGGQAAQTQQAPNTGASGTYTWDNIGD